MKLYRLISITFAVIFAIVGMLFLLMPDAVIVFFNTISTFVGMPVVPTAGFNFYVVLAAGYMYIVTVLAFLMYRNPKNAQLPFLLAQAKIASSFLSFLAFVFVHHCLIYVSNFVIDGIIGGIALTFYLKLKKEKECARLSQ